MVRTVVNSEDGEHLDVRLYHSKQFDINYRVVITKVLETISAVTQLQHFSVSSKNGRTCSVKGTNRAT